jgi:hypothetical protein
VSADGLPLVRKRQARGGGFEYHVTLLSERDQASLRARAAAVLRWSVRDTVETELAKLAADDRRRVLLDLFAGELFE